MEVKVQYFRNPFSFFCLPADDTNALKDFKPENNNNRGFPSKRFDLSGVLHGQYVAVLWNDHWARGIVSMQSQFLIWLVDYGIYFRPSDKTVFVNLPAQDKRYPTKVFEASLHGVTPVAQELTLTDKCEIINEDVMTWSKGAIERGQEMINNAEKIYFMPAALLSTKLNDVVVGDLYLRIKGQGVVKMKDVLEEWPIFSRKDPELYVKNLAKFYINRRQHRASLARPSISLDLPVITIETTVAEYSAISAAAPTMSSVLDAESDESAPGSVVTYRNSFKLTPEEMETYSGMYITLYGQEYNLLNVLRNKARDHYLCVRYADQQYIGRATSRSTRIELDNKN